MEKLVDWLKLQLNVRRISKIICNNLTNNYYNYVHQIKAEKLYFLDIGTYFSVLSSFPRYDNISDNFIAGLFLSEEDLHVFFSLFKLSRLLYVIFQKTF